MVHTRSHIVNQPRITRSNTNVKIKFAVLESSSRQRQKKSKAYIRFKKYPDVAYAVYEIDDKDEDITYFVDEEDLDENASVITEIDDILRHDVNTSPIDFDEAHTAWTANKKKNSFGLWEYICGKTLKSGKKCRRSLYDKSGFYSGCKIHYCWEENVHMLLLGEDTSPTSDIA